MTQNDLTSGLVEALMVVNVAIMCPGRRSVLCVVVMKWLPVDSTVSDQPRTAHMYDNPQSISWRAKNPPTPPPTRLNKESNTSGFTKEMWGHTTDQDQYKEIRTYTEISTTMSESYPPGFTAWWPPSASCSVGDSHTGWLTTGYLMYIHCCSLFPQAWRTAVSAVCCSDCLNQPAVTQN